MIPAALGAASCGVWVVGTAWAWRNLRLMRRLADLDPPGPAVWPRVSVLVPARNEADTLEPACASLLALDYPDLEIILVDDRSTDETGAVVDRLAARDARITPIHVVDLPPGWLGKVHALERARERATGEWLLFTDADVHFAPDALKRAVALALAEGAGHVALLPEVTCRSFWLRAAVASFGMSFFLAFDGRKLGKPGSGVTMGVGAFNLVRRSALEATAELHDLKLEVIDDVGLAQILNRAGVPAAVLAGAGLVRIEWYRSLGAMVHGLEKGAFGVLGYRAWRGWAVAGVTVGLVAGLGLAARSLPHGPALVGAVLAFQVVVAASGITRMGGPTTIAPFVLPGLLINAWITLRSAVVCSRRGTVVWRDTAYPLDSLRAGRRVSFW